MNSNLLAQAPTPVINTTTFPAARFTDISTLLNVFVPLLSLGAAIIFGVMLIYAAFTILTSVGEADKIQKAKNILTFSIIGLILVTCAFVIVEVVKIVTGTNV
jgi:hypothetical protein